MLAGQEDMPAVQGMGATQPVISELQLGPDQRESRWSLKDYWVTSLSEEQVVLVEMQENNLKGMCRKIAVCVEIS